MAVFRIERTNDYTTMSNHHLRNKSLSLKAKGLLSQMLSLPEEWDYTLAGLAAINKESVDAIRTAVQELEKAGYITRRQTRDEAGKLCGNEYTIYERPQDIADSSQDADAASEPLLENPTTDAPLLENPVPEKPLSEKPLSENPTQLNIDILNTDISKKKNKKRKAEASTLPPLTDTEIHNLCVDWISRIAPEGWNRGMKTRLYKALIRFYAPRETKTETPKRSQAGFDALCSKLLRLSHGDNQTMVDLLDTATTSGWKSVYPMKQNYTQPKPPDTAPGGEYIEI